jgi:hypothetical protein
MKIDLKRTKRSYSHNIRQALLLKSFVLVWIVCMFSSCLSSKKINAWVTEKYHENLPFQPINNDSISINLVDSLQDKVKIADVKKIKNKKLPLLFYWKWHSTHLCNLNEQIGFGKFSQSFLYYANLSPLKEKLSGKRIELNVAGVPHIFLIDDDGFSLLPLPPFLGSENFTIKPYKKKMVVGYRLYEGKKMKKAGVISIPNTDAVYQQYFLYSPKSMTNDYLKQYDDNMVKMSKTFVDKLLEELFVYKTQP